LQQLQPRATPLRLARFETLAGLVRDEGRLATEFDAPLLGVSPARAPVTVLILA
jgi:hypothetical protein